MRLRLLRRRLTVSAPRMAIRIAAPWPLRWLLAAIVLGFSGALALWAFEFGKEIAGLDRNAKQELQRLRTEVEQLRENLAKAQSYIGNFIPTFLNSSFTILGNLAMMFFMVFFMYTNGQGMENALKKLIPFQENNVRQLAFETNNMVRANALGIPLISLIQGITALIGYWIFGLSDFGLWGFLTGVFAFFPVVGTMIIYVPLVVYLYAQGTDWQATGLLLYNVLITGNVDYLARVTLMRKIGDVHPLVTILGVIVGLGLFGFMGFIFGPLLLSYLILLIRIYTSEFVETTSHHSQPNDLHEPREGHKPAELP